MAEVMREASYFFTAGVGFRVIRFSQQQRLHGWISERAPQWHDWV
jgi:hypothetical protein